MGEDQEDEQDAVAYGGYDEEIDGHDVGDVVLQEAPPGLRGRSPAADHVLLDRRFVQIDSDLAQLADDSRRSPQWIG